MFLKILCFFLNKENLKTTAS